ncbi:MAG: hypothetical protein ABIR91_02650, partial [Candidatus Saccharimonadales bacterium]
MARHRLESAPDINAQDRTPDDVVREIIEHTSLLEELHAQGMTKDSLYFKSTLNQLKELRNEFAYHAGLSLESEATAPTGKRAIELPRDNEIDETPVLDELLAEYGLDENYSDITVKQTGRHTTEQIDDTPIDSSPIYDQLLMERALEAAGPAPTIPPKPANPPVVPANGELSPAPKLETKATLDSSHESTDATDKAPALQTSASLELPEDSKDQVPELRTTATLESSDDNDESAPELKTTATLDMSDDNDMLAPALVTTATLESSEFDKPKLRDRLKKRFNAWRENRTIDSPERTTEEKHERRRRGTVKALATLAGLALLATGITQSQKEGSGNDTTPTPD